MRAGFAEREYTPEKGPVPGQIKVMYAEGKNTPLMAHVAVIESEGIGSVIVTLDIIFVSTPFATKMRNRISEITEYPYENIMITCSHTHTGCAMDVDCWEFDGDPKNLENVEAAIIDAVNAAYASRADIKIGIGTGFDKRFNFCRDFYTEFGTIVMNPGGSKYKDKLVRPYAAVDHTVNVMRFDDMDGNAKCFAVNYANHLDTNPSKAKFDADFPGYMRLALREEYGDDVVVLFLNGCCANVNHYDYMNASQKTAHCREGVLPPREIGNGLAETIKNIQPQIVTSEKNINIQGASRMHLTTRRRADEKQIAWAKDILARYESGEEIDLHSRLLADLYIGDEKNPPANMMDIEISVLQIGPWTIVALPGEIYSDIGLRIKANSPFANTIVVEIANGYNGYVSPDTIQRSGCYEGRYSKVAYTGLGSEKVLIDGATNMLNALIDADNIKCFGTLKPSV